MKRLLVLFAFAACARADVETTTNSFAPTRLRLEQALPKAAPIVVAPAWSRTERVVRSFLGEEGLAFHLFETAISPPAANIPVKTKRSYGPVPSNLDAPGPGYRALLKRFRVQSFSAAKNL
jgi:hypothetical protein